jgi:hypothetical protein
MNKKIKKSPKDLHLLKSLNCKKRSNNNSLINKLKILNKKLSLKKEKV